MALHLIKTYLETHYVMLFELIGLLIMLKISIQVSKRSKQFTFAVIALLIIESIAYDIEVWTRSLDTLTLLRPMLSAFIYSIFPVILLFMTYIMSEKAESVKKHFLLLSIPIIVCSILFFTSQWTHIVCWYTKGNNFQRGVLSYLPYYLSGFYVAVCLLRSIIYFRKSKSVTRLISVYIAFGSCIGILTYFILDISDDYSALVSSAILLYYICFYIHLTRVDSLTHLLNRFCFYQDIRDNSEKITVVASIDMNGLKELNDKQGHGAGDKALKVVADVLRNDGSNNYTSYRIGGDEFIILFFGATEKEAEDTVAVMREKLSHTPYSCAFGVAKKNDSGSIDDALKLADERMYEDKLQNRR